MAYVAFIYPQYPFLRNYYTTFDNTGYDSGFDLFVPYDIIVPPNARSYKIDHQVSIVLSKYDTTSDTLSLLTSPYYLEPRSSTGSRTPLRLANSHGIIDAGYRGPLIAVVDNLSSEPYRIEAGTRLFQITRPNLKPFHTVCMTTHDDANDDFPSSRGTGGFGSTGMGMGTRAHTADHVQ